MPIRLFDQETGRELGTITEEQFLDLTELLEEETRGDTDRFVNQEAVEYLEEQGADAALCAMLKEAVGEGEGIEVGWKKD